jgi:cellulose synthase/poly-beta-1,6-N-acetylglucosamine synthase-like glycosyltransferase
MPSVAVVVPTFNRLSLLKETITSLERQTLKDAEFIIVDDRSDSETRHFLGSLAEKDSRFRIIEKPPDVNRGSQASRNIGLDALSADSVVFLDSDDLLEPSSLEQRWSELVARPDIDIVVGRQAILSSDAIETPGVNVPSDTCDLDRFLSISHPIDVPWVNGGVMIRTSSLRASRIRWRPSFHWDDVAFHFECVMFGMKSYWMRRDSSPDSYYRMHDGERYGSVLMSDEGLLSATHMIGWMSGMLRDASQLTPDRSHRLAFSFFNGCVLRAVDERRYNLATRLLAQAVDFNLVSLAKARSIALWIQGRRALRYSSRATYFWNKLSERIVIPQFFSTATSTYGTISAKSVSIAAMA